MIALSVLGLGAFLQAAPSAFSALRWGGAVYLAWLGLKPWLSGVSAEAHDAPPPPRGGFYREGLLVALSNPKALLFAGAFLPQFMDPGLARGPQLAWLALMFAVIEISCYFAYALGGRGLSSWLRRPRVRLAFDRAAGLLFMGFAAALTLS
jgi:threonine/homoserine/homoserine lactone efflux protein